MLLSLVHIPKYCTLIDYIKVLDSVWRDGFWLKLLKSGKEGKLFNVMKNMYSGIKSCVFLNGKNSPYCTPLSPHEGIRQGENLSPFLFSLCNNDIKELA